MIGLLLAVSVAALAANQKSPVAWTESAPEVSLVESSGYSALQVADERYLVSADEVGAPALPLRSVLVAIPDHAALTGMTYEVTWEPVATGVKIVPIAEPVRVGSAALPLRPDAGIYGGSSPYPDKPVKLGGEELMCGVRVVSVGISPFRWHPQSGLLERATRLTVRVGFGASRARSYVLAKGMVESVREQVVNPESVDVEVQTTAGSLLRTAGMGLQSVANANEGKVDYLLLAPPDFVADWQWYVGERKKTHPNVMFLVKNTAEIYAEYPFGEGKDNRNAAESIHAYLRDNRTKMGFSYVVLGGAWLDAQNRKGTKPCFYGGEEMSLSNCVPGVYGYPREDWREIPSDMFYACLDMIGGQKYPWDANANNIYIDQNDCSKNDLKPDVCVTRITLNPYRPNSWTAYNRHTLVTNYVDKLRRGEDKYFQGHFRYGLSPDSTGSRRLRANGDRMYYDELEFYDNMYNMADPRHSKWIEDNEVEPRRRVKYQFACWRPVLEARGMMNYTWTKGFSNLSAATADYYAGNRDYGFVYSHGWAQGATHFQAGQFATCKGLTILNGSNGPCDTGYVDYHVTMNGKPTLQYNLGDSGVSNPDGGALASINNTRWGWAGGSHTGLDFDSSMSYFMLNRSLVGFNQLYKDVGHAWFKGVSDYASFNFTQGGGTHTWTLTEQICYGDPLVRLPAPEDRWWNGGETGVWDRVTTCWTNTADEAVAFYPASNVYFTAYTAGEITVATNVGMLYAHLPVAPNGCFSFLGAEDGQLRVMKRLDVSGGDLRLNVAGGVGHDGIVFTKADGQTRAGALIFEGDHSFYVGKVTGASRVEMRGGGVVLDADQFPSATLPLVFAGPGKDAVSLPNELRSYRAGGLMRFGALAITNSAVKLASADAFGRDNTPTAVSLAGSRLEIAANAFYERKGCYQVSGYAENLNAAIAVAGDSEVTSSEGGLWTVSKTTTFTLATNATLRLSAETKDCGGKIVIKGTGVVEVASAQALSGQIEIGPGVRLELNELPLESVTALTLAEGAEVVLPHAKSGYWQILPVSSKLTCPAGVKFYSSQNPTNEVAGTAAQTGAFFRDGALYEWSERDGHWTSTLARSEPKVLFGDLADCVEATVRVDLAIAPEFVSFANAKMAYRFVEGAEGASLSFDNIILNGDVSFELPVSASGYVEALSGVVSFDNVISPTVRITSTASLALKGSHWATFMLEEGATLKALPNERLNWNSDTSITFPESGTVTIDVSALTLSDVPQVLISGRGHTWTVADLGYFTLAGGDAELRIDSGALCVVRGDGLKGPYTLEFNGTTNWNTSGWLANGSSRTPFVQTWSASTLDWTADATLVAPLASNDLGRVAVTVDCAVVAQDVIVAPTSNKVFLAAANGGCLDVAAVDLQSCLGGVELDVPTEGAEIIAPTNANSLCRLIRAGCGLVTMDDSTVQLDVAGTWTLAVGAQGTLSVVVSNLAERTCLVKLASGFKYPDGAFEVRVLDRYGQTRSDCTVVKDGDALWMTPPAIHAEVPAGTNDFAALTWFDANDDCVTISDWTKVSAVAFTGSGTITSATHFASFPTQVKSDGDVTLSGAATWSPSSLTGAGTLTLADGFVLDVNLGTNSSLLNARKIVVNRGAAIMVRAGGDTRNITDQNWSGITGEGLLAFVGGTSKWIAMPKKRFASTLSFLSDVDLVLTEDVSESSPLRVSNFAGSGTYRMDWNSQTHTRYISTVQTLVSEYTGHISAPAGSRNAGLIVASDENTATTNKALVLSGTAVAAQEMKIEPTGCVILTGTWLGKITVQGVLAITNSATTNGMDIVLKDAGKVILLDALPPIADLMPAAPEEEEEEQPVEDTTVREVVADVPATAANWGDLAWQTTNGTPTVVTDWSAIRKATLRASAESGVVTVDAYDFTGIAVLKGSVSLESHRIPAFQLGASSSGRLEVRLSEAPTQDGTWLLKTETDYSANGEMSVALRNRFGDTFLAPVSVVCKAAGYALQVQNFNSPAYRHTFDGSVVNPNYNATDLAETSDSKYFIPSRDGQAIVNYYCGSKNGWNLMSPFPTSWTVNMVAKMPTNQGGVLFGFGYGGYCDKGFCFAADGTDRVSLCIWRNWNVTSRLTANVPLSTQQFHVYTATYDSATVRFYVDGVEVANLADTEGFTASNGGCYQFWGLCSGKYPGGLTGAGGNGGAVDDWSFYKFCATPESVRYLASEFPTWPECRSARVMREAQSLADIEWSEEGDASLAHKLIGAGGSLVLDKAYTFTPQLRLSGDPLTLALSEEGCLIAQGGIVNETSLTIDVGALSGPALAANAVDGVAYSRWLVRGATSGTTIAVTNLPTMPHGYTVEVDRNASYGIRLIVKAPWFARFGALSYNFAGYEKNVNATVSQVAGNAAYSGLRHGAYPVLGSKWVDLSAENKDTTDGDVTISVTQVANPYYTKTTVGDQILYGYADDGSNPTVQISNIPFAKFRIITYCATDNGNTCFSSAWMGSSVSDCVAYYGPTRGSSTGGYTLSGPSEVSWGDTDLRGSLAEGINYVVSDVITGEVGKATAFIRLIKASPARACLAAFQIVEVGKVYESSAVEFEATVTNDTLWANGTGSGLVTNLVWQNDTNSIITLKTEAGSTVSVTFDTPVTAQVLKVVSAAGSRLKFENPAGVPFTVETLDLSGALGETVFVTNWLGNVGLETKTGTRLRFEAKATQPVLTQANTVIAYQEATFGSIANFNWVLCTEDSDDAVVLSANGVIHYVPLEVAGGKVTYDIQGGTECTYGGNSSTGTNSVITVTGGEFFCNVTGTSTAGSNRGLILGCTGSAVQKTTLIVSGGLFNCPNGLLAPWEHAQIRQYGGVIRALGIRKGGNNAGAMSLMGGTLELGRLGIVKNGGGAFPITLAGGYVLAKESASVTLPITLSSSSHVAAEADQELIFTEALTGGGALTVGETNATGKVTFRSTSCNVGNVTLKGGSFSTPLGTLRGNVSVAEGATLDIVNSGDWDAEEYAICSGELTLDDKAVFTLNGAELPSYCRREGNRLLVTTAAHSWTNPVTSATAKYTYRFTGEKSGSWLDVANWQKFSVSDWKALSGSNVPMLPNNGIWDPTVVDGAFVTNVANRNVSLGTEMEGWVPRLALYNGVTVTVAKINKFQGNGAPKWFWVDATSQLVLNSFGSGTYDETVPLYVASSNGVVFAKDFGAEGATFDYYLKGTGSVTYAQQLTKNNHRICAADFRLDGRGVGKTVRSKLLVSLKGDSTKRFTVSSASVTMTDAEGEIVTPVAKTEVTALDALGSYAITQRVDGVWLDFVDRVESEHYVHEVEGTDDVHRVEIPYKWLMQLTNDTIRLLEPTNLTPKKVSEAMERVGARNGMKPWQSYVLGLEPTNETDRVTVGVSFVDGKVRVDARGLDSSKFRSGAKVKYRLQATESLDSAFQTIGEAQESKDFDTSQSEYSARFFRILVDIVW